MIIGVGSIFIVLLIVYILLTRIRHRGQPPASPLGPGFSGARFEGYFLNTRSGKEIPVLNWHASCIENKKMMTLSEMFKMLDVEEKLPEANRIYFEAVFNGREVEIRFKRVRKMAAERL